MENHNQNLRHEPQFDDDQPGDSSSWPGGDVAHFVILDDDNTFAQMLSRSLKNFSISSIHHTDLESFLDKKDPCTPDVFVVDLSMSDPTGVLWEFGGLLTLKKLRDTVGADPMIWVLTGYEDPRIERECARNGANSVFFKSFGVAETAEDLALAWRAIKPRETSPPDLGQATTGA